MMRTLIALLAASAISLPAAAQQADMRQSPGQDQTSRPKTQNIERGAGGGQRAANQDRDRGSRQMDGARRGASREHGSGLKGESHLRGRTGYYESGRRYGVRSRGAYEEYGRGRGYSYIRGRRVYGRDCPRYIYLDGRRVFNERCLGHYSRYYERGPRYRRRFSSREEYGVGREGVYSGRRTAIREYGRNRGGERAGINERRGAVKREGSLSENQGNPPARTARNRPGGQAQGEAQPGAR